MCSCKLGSFRNVNGPGERVFSTCDAAGLRQRHNRCSKRGEVDEAFKWMDRAIERRDPSLRHVMLSPYLDNMREDPRFDDALIRIGLKPVP